MSKFEPKYFLNVIMTFNAIRFPIAFFLEAEQVKMTPIWTWFFVVIIFRFAKSITILLYPAP